LRLSRARHRVKDFRPEGRGEEVTDLRSGLFLSSGTGLRFEPPQHKRACLLLDRIKREKGVWWMPWQQEAMKDVVLCDKLGGGENTL
jgi:hypothetical protein